MSVSRSRRGATASGSATAGPSASSRRRCTACTPYTAGIVGALCAATAASPLFARIAFAPHPEFGVAHLRRLLDGIAVEAADATLVIDIPWLVARAQFSTLERDAQAPLIWRSLREDQTFASSVQRAVAGMMGGEALTIDRVAAASGMTVRTFQRRLDEDGATFSEAVDAARRCEALALIAGTDLPFTEVASRLGFANASAFTRAVRRWTGASPRTLRSDGVHGGKAR